MSYKGQINETPKGCQGCCFRQTASGVSICGYSLFMGEPRNCPVEECSFYSGAPRGPKFRKQKLEKRVGKMHDRNLEAYWVGEEPEEFEEREEYIPEYYPECGADYDYE